MTFKIQVHTLFYWLFPALLVTTSISYSQNIESIGKEKPIKVSGSLNTTQTFYGVSGIPNRRPPYSSYINGGVTFNIYEWVVPFSVSWSNQNRTVLRQPFNQYGVSPHWRWITAHIGYRNMTFSPYTLAGYTFLGGGVDLTPGIFRFSAMYGRLNKAVKEDNLNARNEVPSFKRMGMGCKIGVGKASNYIDLIWFSAKDDPLSIPIPAATANVLPAENMVFAVNAQKQLGKRLTFGLEYARSAYTRDIRTQKAGDANPTLFSPFFTIRSSTQFFSAFKSSITYNANFYSIGLAYEKIDPEYRTLGAYFFNNDIENITVAPSIRVFKQKMNISSNLGIQRNNLDKQNISTVKRFLASANITYVPNQKWNFAGQYSNFKTFNKISPAFNQFQSLDTLSFYQLTESASLNLGYNSSGKEIRHGANINLSFQRANQTQGEQISSNSSKFFNANLLYRYSYLPGQLNISTGLNANQNLIGGKNGYALGPTVNVSKLLFEKKLRSSVTVTYNTILSEKVSTGRALNTVLMLAYSVNKNHNFMMNMIVLNKNSKTSHSYTEFTGNISYSYTF